MDGKEIIGTTRCWVCDSELALTLIPLGCEQACAKTLIAHGHIAGGNGEKAWLCGTHLIVWHDRQRKACLKSKAPLPRTVIDATPFKQSQLREPSQCEVNT